MLEALDQAPARNVSGGRVYDYGHALSATKAKAEVILTRNQEDFRGLCGSLRIEWP